MLGWTTTTGRGGMDYYPRERGDGLLPQGGHDVTECQPVGNVEEHEGAGEYYSRYSVLKIIVCNLSLNNFVY